MIDYLKYIDLFPIQVSLTHKGGRKFRNSFSALLSIIIISGMIASTIFFGRNFFERLNPQVIFKSSPTGNYPYTNQNSTTFFAAAALTDFSRKPVALDERYFSIIFRYTEHLTVDGKEIWNVSYFNTTPCNELNITNPFYKDLNSKTRILDGYLCPIIPPFILGGDASQMKEYWLDIVVKDCVNTTSKKNCKPNSEIKNFFYDKHFILNTLDHYAIVDDYSSPIKDKRTYISKYISYQFYQGIELLYENLTVTTDAGLVFQSLNHESIISLKEEINNLSIYPEFLPWSRTLVQFTIKLTNSMSEYKRNYMKAQELSAFIGGIFNVYLLIGRCVVFIVTNNFFYHDLAESFYSNDEDNLILKKLSSNESNLKLVSDNLKTDNFLNNAKKNKDKEISIPESPEIININKNLNKTIDDKNNYIKNINKMSLCDLVCFSLRRKREKEKYKIFNQISQEIEKNLEVNKKLRLYKEFELLTNYILNEIELTAFNYQNYSIIKNFENVKSDESRLQEMIEYYKEKKRSKILNNKDEILMNNLKKKIIEKIIY